MSEGYPKSAVVLPGAILGYLVNSITTAQGVHFSSLTWEDHGYFTKNGQAVYGTNDGQGIYGAILFEGKSLVGIFYDTRSERAPYQAPDNYDLNRFFHGMPPNHWPLVERVLAQYFYEIVNDIKIPSVTAAFWSDGEYLTAADPWDVVLAHGARLIRIELMEDTDEALAEWQADYDMTPQQVTFARSLFKRKMARPAATITLTQREVEWLRSTSEEPNEVGINVCREKLKTIGILMP
jgi:hypothetical protein